MVFWSPEQSQGEGSKTQRNKEPKGKHKIKISVVSSLKASIRRDQGQGWNHIMHMYQATEFILLGYESK